MDPLATDLAWRQRVLVLIALGSVDEQSHGPVATEFICSTGIVRGEIFSTNRETYQSI
jgi:hypothetical protein